MCNDGRSLRCLFLYFRLIDELPQEICYSYHHINHSKRFLKHIETHIKTIALAYLRKSSSDTNLLMFDQISSCHIRMSKGRLSGTYIREEPMSGLWRYARPQELHLSKRHRIRLLNWLVLCYSWPQQEDICPQLLMYRSLYDALIIFQTRSNEIKHQISILPQQTHVAKVKYILRHLNILI